MRTAFMKPLLLAAAMLLAPLLAQPAHADSFVDFACGGSGCTGTVTNSGGVYSTTGIGGLVQTVNGGTDFNTGAFNLVFNTSTNAISLTGNSAANNDKLTGSIIGVMPTTNAGLTLLGISVNWTSLPADFASYLNASSASSIGSVIYLTSGGTATSVDFTVTPTATPEPATFVMLGAGLLGLCGFFGRKAFNPAA
jgi:hypothetical protein